MSASDDLRRPNEAAADGQQGQQRQPGLASRRHPWGTSPIVWYRPSIRKVVWRLWGLASLWVSIGAVCLGMLRVMRVDFGSAWIALYAVGFAFVAAGPWQLFVGLQRTAQLEQVLSVHNEGVRWQDGAVVAHWAWDYLDAVEVADKNIALRHDSERLVLPGEMDGIEATALAAMLMDMRRKALLGLPVRPAVIPDRA